MVQETLIQGRPKTLEETKRFLLAHLAERRHPFMACREPEVARETIERLDGLDGERWAATWGGTAARFEAEGQAAEARGDAAAARHAYFHAYFFNYLGRFPCANDPHKLACAQRARENYLRAARYFDPPLTRVALPFAGRPDEGREVVIYARRPAGVARPPVVVAWGGIDFWKEEGTDLSGVFLGHGIATVFLDTPGTGESPVIGSPDAERQYTPVFEWVRAQPDLDGARIGCIGMSFGGYWATKLAHTHREYLAAAVSWGGGAHHLFQPHWIEQSRYPDTYLMDIVGTRSRMLGATDDADYIARFGRLSLLDQGLLDGDSAPLLLVNGKDDRQTPVADIYLLLEHGRPKHARVFPGGHMGRTPETQPTIVRWLCEQLGAGA